MKRMLLWFLMLSKRLYKKPSFVALLVLIPLCVLAFRFAADQGSGFVHIVLAQHEKEDAISSEVIEKLMSDSSILHFTLAESPEEALEEVRSGKADEAWIFPADTEKELEGFVSGKRDYVVSVVAKEQSIALRLAREKLSAVLYKDCAKAYYIDYIRSNLPELEHVSQQELILYFENVSLSEDFFVLGDPVGAQRPGKDANYLTSPLRGLLAIFAVLCGMAATIYYMQDSAAGMFAHVKQRRNGLLALGCVVTAIVNIALVLLLSQCLSSPGTDLGAEAVSLLMYIFCCASFCLLLGQIFTSIPAYCAMIPLLTVVFIGVCPVFHDFKKLSVLQALFPPSYYVKSAYDDRWLFYMLIYTLACFALSYGLQILKRAAKARRTF